MAKATFGIFCVFDWVEKSPRHWKLVTTADEDDDGYVEGERWASWCKANCSKYEHCGKGFYDWVPTPGKLIIQWTWEGVYLAEFNPPDAIPKWLSSTALAQINKKPGEWDQFITDGYWARTQVIQEARKRFGGGQ